MDPDFRNMLLNGNKHSALLRATAAAIFAFLCLLAAGAPLLAAHGHYAASSVIHFGFSAVCHQLPERSLSIEGWPMAVCHRCTGVYLGLALGSFIKSLPGILRKRRAWIVTATLPLLADALLPLTGLINNTPLSRFCTGLLFGTMLATFFMQGIRELASRLRCGRLLCKGEAL